MLSVRKLVSRKLFQGQQIAIGAVGSLFLKVAFTGLSFFISVVLARIMGASFYGAYAYGITWATLLAVPALFGLDQLSVRMMSVYQASEKWSLLRGMLIWANQVVLLSSAIVAACAWLALYFVNRLTSFQHVEVMSLAMLLVPIVSLTRLRQATMRGLRHVVQGQLPEFLVQPLIFLTAIGLLFYQTSSIVFSPRTAILLHILSAIIAFTIGIVMLNSVLPTQVHSTSSEKHHKQWVASAWPLMIVGGMRILNIRVDTIMIGIFEDTAVVGIYTAATRGAELITFILLAVNAAIAPYIARLHARNELDKLQHLITLSARGVFITTFPIAIGLIIFGQYFLGLFGTEFIDGQNALTILIGSRLISATLGSTGTILTMTGHERDVAWGVGASGIANILLNMFLIPRFGITGAALSTATTMVVWNVILVFCVHYRLKLHTTALGRISFSTVPNMR